MSHNSSHPWQAWLATQAAEREAAGLQRVLALREANTSLIDLAGNDYLGLSDHPEVVDAAYKALITWGVGARASRLVSGTTRAHSELEVALAEFTGQPDALVTSSGYHANLSVLSALADKDIVVLSDAHIHASLIDGCRLARARVEVIPHNDTAALAQALNRHQGSRIIALVESIYSVLSDAAPLAEQVELTRAAGALLVIDEAHGLGVVGPHGRGLYAELGLEPQPHVVLTATLSKSLGSQGGAVLGSEELIDQVVNRARPFIFDTGLAPAMAAGAMAALTLINPAVVARLRARITTASERLKIATPAGAVLSVPMSSPEEALAAQAACRDQGVWVGCFRPPSVPDGVSRLRITANAGLDQAAWDHAINVVASVVKPRV